MENDENLVQVIINHKIWNILYPAKFLNRRKARWSEIFSKFNIKIIYRPGSFNNKTDVFTRQLEDVFFKKKPSSISMANNIEKKLNIQQLTLGPITNEDSDNSETVSNPDSIDD